MARRITRRALSAPVFGAASCTTGAANPVVVPDGKTILTVPGRIGATKRDGVAAFDLAMLETLGTEGFETTTPWYSGPVYPYDGKPELKAQQFYGRSVWQVTKLVVT